MIESHEHQTIYSFIVRYGDSFFLLIFLIFFTKKAPCDNMMLQRFLEEYEKITALPIKVLENKCYWLPLLWLMETTGLEPVTVHLWGGCSNQLNYVSTDLVRSPAVLYFIKSIRKRVVTWKIFETNHILASKKWFIQQQLLFVTSIIVNSILWIFQYTFHKFFQKFLSYMDRFLHLRQW